MNSILKPIIPSLWLAVFFFVFPAAVSAQSLTISQVQQVNSGLFRSNSQDFFEQGNRQLASEGKILEIDEKLRSQLCREDFLISSRYHDTISAAEIASFQPKLNEICRQK
ncbi:MAG: hypothetical protein EAZ23_22635 [Oscillatoriales cyanobacterium]|nr:MAG: hypothetical protein EAZ23_22635 [Oscillatoriales cyanobacterium]